MNEGMVLTAIVAFGVMYFIVDRLSKASSGAADHDPGDAQALIGSEVLVERFFADDGDGWASGSVTHNGEVWPARMDAGLAREIEIGQKLEVSGAEDVRLTVVPR